MQKMQAAAGGKPLGPNGQPSPAQIEAMRVSRRGVAPYLGEGFFSLCLSLASRLRQASLLLYPALFPCERSKSSIDKVK